MGLAQFLGGEIAKVGGGDDGLPAPAGERHQPAAPRDVELAHDVVQEQQRTGRSREHLLPLGQDQGQEDGALLALRSAVTHVQPAAEQAQIVPMRAEVGVGALAVGFPAVGQPGPVGCIVEVGRVGAVDQPEGIRRLVGEVLVGPLKGSHEGGEGGGAPAADLQPGLSQQGLPRFELQIPEAAARRA